MNGTETTLGRPVAGLQRMLRTLSREYRDIPPLLPTGRFGPSTMEGVMVFQREAGLPVTGRADYPTWKALAEEYERVSRRLEPSAGGIPFPADGIRAGEENPLLYAVQGMFCALAVVLADFRHETPTGKCGETTVFNIRTLQRCAGLEETGRLDRAAWECLFRLYGVVLGIRE